MTAEDLDKKIQDMCAQMHNFSKPEKIEQLRKVIRKNVSFFDRSLLLAFLVLKSDERIAGALSSSSCDKNSAKTDFQKQSKQTREQTREQTNERIEADGQSVQLWTNVYFFNKEKIEEFFSFLCQNAKIERKDIIYIKKVKNFSFLTVKKTAVDRILETFKEPVMWGNLKVVIKEKSQK